MKESYVEGVAIHDDPESCVVAREGADEAFVIGRPNGSLGALQKRGDVGAARGCES